MRSRVGALVVACLGLAANAHAYRFEVSPQFSVSMPAGDISKAFNTGFCAGATATYWPDSTAGIGFDLAYHGWGSSSAFNAAVDDLLSFPPYLLVTGSSSTVGIIQATAHVKHLMPMRGPISSWIQVGAGMYDYRSQLVILGHALHDNQLEFGVTGALGLDASRVPLGVDASYHYMLSRSSFDFGDHIQLFTAGVHFRLL